MLLVGLQKGHPACKKTEWWGAGVVIFAIIAVAKNFVPPEKNYVANSYP